MAGKTLNESFPTPPPPPSDKKMAEIQEGSPHAREQAHVASTDEAKKILFALIAALRPFEPTEVKTLDGDYEVLASRKVAGSSFVLGFHASISGANQVSFQPSLVSVDGQAYVPKVGGVLLTEADTPLALAAGQTASLRVEWVPDDEEVPGSSPTEYRVGGIAEIVSSEVTIVNDQSDEQPALVDSSTGNVDQNGIFHWPICMRRSGTGRLFQLSWGPVALQVCGGIMAAQAPNIIHSGEVVYYGSV